MSVWYAETVAKINKELIVSAKNHQLQLTKPPGSLGRLEELAVAFCGYQGTVQPSLKHVQVAVFAGDHGVCQQDVSLFPQSVTGQMLVNFAKGGAAINVLCADIGADLTVVNLGLAEEIELPAEVSQHIVAKGTRDFSQEPAMTEEQCLAAMDVGRQYALKGDPHILIGGEMGIGNTTSAAALYCALLELDAEQTVGPGTGVAGERLQNKRKVVAQALHLHQAKRDNPLQLLAALGGFEIAALVGFYIATAQRGVPVLIDGYICTAAALIARELNPGCSRWFLFSHQSAEPAHVLALKAFNTQTILQLGLRLGEGSGAAMAIPIIRMALSLHNNMATFAQAGVSDSD